MTREEQEEIVNTVTTVIDRLTMLSGTMDEFHNLFVETQKSFQRIQTEFDRSRVALDQLPSALSAFREIVRQINAQPDP